MLMLLLTDGLSGDRDAPGADDIPERLLPTV